MSDVRSKALNTIGTFLSNVGKEPRPVELGDDLHKDVGLTSDEGVLLVMDLEDQLGVKLPKDFNAVVHDSGTRGRKFSELVEKLEELCESAGGAAA